MSDSLIPTDPHAGQGGSYVVQPDGTRSLRERTEPPPERKVDSPERLEPEPAPVPVPEGESSTKPVPRRQKPALTEMPVRKADSVDAPNPETVPEPTSTPIILETDHVPGD